MAHRPTGPHPTITMMDCLDINRRRHGNGTLDAKVPGREDVGHENECSVREGVRYLEDGAVSQGNPHILGLAAVEQLRAQEQALDTAGRESVVAVKAVLAGLHSANPEQNWTCGSVEANHDTVNGETTLSPTSTVFTSEPASTTTPVNS